MKRLLALGLVGAAGLLAATPAFAFHPPRPVIAPPPVVVEYPPVAVLPPVCPVYTLDTFARDFRPVPGKHHIQIVHPRTKCPVDVCFELPCGKLRELEVNRRSIEFDYGRHEVKIVFRHNGTVDVRAD
jgi:hypothetical protein